VSKGYELEIDALAMRVYFGDTEVACAMAMTHGGWAMYLRGNNPVDVVEGSRKEAIKWLEKRFPGLQEAA
jgi:hypothetical protein